MNRDQWQKAHPRKSIPVWLIVAYVLLAFFTFGISLAVLCVHWANVANHNRENDAQWRGYSDGYRDGHFANIMDAARVLYEPQAVQTDGGMSRDEYYGRNRGH